MKTDAKIDLSPLTVSSGKITTFTVKTDAKNGVVHLPNNTLPMINGKLGITQDLNFQGHEFTFQTMIPPSVLQINITISSGGSQKTFLIFVEDATERLVSGEQVYERMEYVTNPDNGMMRRVTSHPQLEMGARYFEGLFSNFGLEAEVIRYWDQPVGSPRDRIHGMMIWNVVAYHWGENTKE
jgi:hypothetical protein